MLKSKPNGFSLAQLRNQKVKRQKIDSNVGTAALILENNEIFDEHHNAIRTSSNIVSLIGGKNNNRWFRNCLYENDEYVDQTNLYKISTSLPANLKSVVTRDDDQKSKQNLFKN